MTGTPRPRVAPVVDAERCVRQRVRDADCAACVHACPTGAWHSSEAGLSFDTDACDGCGLCVAACPTQTLSLPPPQPLLLHRRREDGAPVAWWSCERAGLAASASRAPCLLALAPAWLHRVATRLEVRDHVFVPGACSRCERGAGLAEWQRQWRAQAALAASQGNALRLRVASATEWPADADAAVDAGRRRFFGGAAAPRVGDTLTSAREDVWADAPATAAAPPLWRVAFDRARCTLCLACTQVCPTGAIFIRVHGADGNSARFGFDAQRCTSCGMCAAVCADGALAMPQPVPPAPPGAVPAHVRSDWPVRTRRCPQCRIDFRQFADAPDTPHSHSSCLTCSQGRVPRADRIVQT